MKCVLVLVKGLPTPSWRIGWQHLERGWGNGDIIDVLQIVFWLVSVAFFLWGQYQQTRAVDRRFTNVAADQEQAAIPLVDVQPQLMLL